MPRPPVPPLTSNNSAAVANPPVSLVSLGNFRLNFEGLFKDNPLQPDTPIRPTFPAYGGVDTAGSSSITAGPRVPLIVTQSGNSKIVHPEEDISLVRFHSSKIGSLSSD